MEELACPEEQDYFWFPPVSVLKHAKRPMTCRKIIERATEDGLLNSRGKTPVNMLYALLSRHVQEGKQQPVPQSGAGKIHIGKQIMTTS